MGVAFPVGERVIWLSDWGLRLGAEGNLSPIEAEIVRVANGRVLIRVLESASRRHPEHLVDRWVETGSLRKMPA